MMHCFCGLVGSYCWSSALPEDVDNLSVKHGDAAAKGRGAADKGAVWGSSEEQVTGKNDSAPNFEPCKRSRWQRDDIVSGDVRSEAQSDVTAHD